MIKTNKAISSSIIFSGQDILFPLDTCRIDFESKNKTIVFYPSNPIKILYIL